MSGRPRGVFVTGTDTEVGKTVVAAAVARAFAAEGREVAVFKPAVTGLDDFADDGPASHDTRRPGAHRPDDTRRPAAHRPDHELLRRAAGSSQTDDEIAPHRYGPPMSPHLAAEQAGDRIEPDRLLAAARAAADGAELFVCEGVGGLLVPLSLSPPYLVRDFAADLGFPLVIAASPALGTINHTLLTVEAARAVGLEVALIVLTPWPDRPSAVELSNRETIGALGGVPVEALPRLDMAHPESWAPAGRLIRAIRE